MAGAFHFYGEDGSAAIGVLVTRASPVRRALPRPLRIGLAGLLAGLALSIIATGVTLAASPAALPITIDRNPIVADVMGQVTTQTLLYELEGLTGERPVVVAGAEYTIATRNLLETEAISMATRYAYERLSRTGLDVRFHDFSWGDYQWRNVVAEKPGLIDADEIYVIGAHLDSMPEGSVAPGADDNGTGSVAVIMAAELLAPRDLAYTVRFVLFTGEEYGLFGSNAYAAECAARGENLRGVINLDMMGYNTGEPAYDLFALSGDDPGASESRRLAELFAQMPQVYNLDLVTRYMAIDHYPLVGGSDQWSFLDRGYPAILVSENYSDDDFNPNYHQTDDTVSGIDLDYYAELTRASIGAMAHLGRILSGEGVGELSGQIYERSTQQPSGGTAVTATWPAYGYTFVTIADAGGAYSMTLPAGELVLAVVASGAEGYSATVPVTVTAGEITIQDVGLGPSGAPPEEEERSVDIVSPLLSIGERLLAPVFLVLVCAWRLLLTALS
jgi:hypothetical protein